MNYKMIPFIKAEDLQEAVNLQYDLNIQDIAEFLIYDVQYMEDCCILNLNEEDVLTPVYSWETAEDVHIFNCIKIYLRDVFPDCERVVIAS